MGQDQPATCKKEAQHAPLIRLKLKYLVTTSEMLELALVPNFSVVANPGKQGGELLLHLLALRLQPIARRSLAVS